MSGIRRDFSKSLYGCRISVSLGRNRKAFKHGHWYKWDNVSKPTVLLGCGCGNPKVPHKGIYEDYFYACAQFFLYVGPYGLTVWMNNRGSFGSFYSFSHRLIKRFWRARGRSTRYGATLSILSSDAKDGNPDYKRFRGLSIQWSEY